MKHRGKTIWFLLGAAILLLALVVVVPVATQAGPPVPPAPRPTPPLPPPVLPAVAPPQPAPVGTPAVRPTGAPAPRGPDPCATPVAAGQSWTTYTTADGSLSFQYPANWAILGEYTPVGKAAPTNQRTEVSILNVSQTCIGRFQGKGVSSPYFLLKVSVQPDGLQGYPSLGAYHAAHPPGPPEVPIVSDEHITVAGQEAFRTIGKPPTVPEQQPGFVIFAQAGTLYSVEAYDVMGERLAVFNRIIDSMKLAAR